MTMTPPGPTTTPGTRYRLTVRPELTKALTEAGATNDAARARMLGVERSTWVRVRTGAQAPGSWFVGGVLAALPHVDPRDLFEAVPVPKH